MEKYEKYLNRENAPVPQEHTDILDKNEDISAASVLQRSEVNQLFKPGYLGTENGFRRLEDGSFYVAVLTKMPGVTIDMIDWWFWWHAAEPVRYQIWYPEMHFSNKTDFQGSYNDDSKTYRERLHLSTHVVVEDVGLGKDEIVIDFMSPEDFGFDKAKLDPKTYTMICARVGAPDRGVWATEMCHFVRKTEDGVEMRSRFWIGNKVYRMGGFAQGIINSIMNSTFAKTRLIPKEVGSAMFHHCSQEYHNLADILPQLYQEEG